MQVNFSFFQIVTAEEGIGRDRRGYVGLGQYSGQRVHKSVRISSNF
jgi:hypothetical protein